MARQIVVDIIGDSSKFGSAVDKATGKAGGFTNVIKGVGMGAGIGAFNLVAGAIGGVTDALGAANEAYMEDVASQDKLKVALKNSIKGFNGQTDAIESVISAQMRLGFGDEEQRDSLALLVGSTNDIVKAQELQVAAMDLARLKGIDLATATDIMLKANEGNYRGLKSVGISLDANATSTEALAAVTALAGGQAEAFANGPLGKQAAAQLKVGESMERIGAVVSNVAMVVLPIVADAFEGIVNVLTEVWSAVQPLVSVLVDALGPAFHAIAGFITGVIFPAMKTLIGTYFANLAKAVSLVADLIGNVSKVVLPVLGGAFQVVGSIVGIITKGIGLLGDGARRLGDIFAALASKVRGAWNGILGAIKGVINAIIRGWNSIQFTFPSFDLPWGGTFGGFTIGTPNIPTMHQGGIVPGMPGSDVPAILQAGEQVIPRKDVGNATEVHIHIGMLVADGPSLDRFAGELAHRIQLART